MSLGFAFALLLTLQSLQLVSTQTFSPLNGKAMIAFAGIPDSWKRENAETTPEEESYSMTFSGDDENHGQHDNMNTTLSDQTTIKINDITTTNNVPSILQNITSSPVKPNQYVETTVGSHVNLTETTDTTSPSPGNSNTVNYMTTTITSTTTIPVFNSTLNSTSTVSENLTTTSPPQDGNYTNSTSENSAHTTTSMNNNTSIVELDKFSTTPTKLDQTGGFFDVRGNVDRGLSSDTIGQETKRQAWGVILGVGVAVAIVGTVIYMIVKRRNYRDFSHRKLVEDMPPAPVLRLDNSEPLDLKFDGFAYYNPGLQGDSIQMTNFPQGHNN